MVVNDSGDTGNSHSNTATTTDRRFRAGHGHRGLCLGFSLDDRASRNTTDFVGYLASHSLGDAALPTLGYALQTGANQLIPLPWANINTISVQFSGPVSNIGLGSLELVGWNGDGSVAAPAVTGFSSVGNNTYSVDPRRSAGQQSSMCLPSPRRAARLALPAAPRSPTAMVPASAAPSRPTAVRSRRATDWLVRRSTSSSTSCQVMPISLQRRPAR